MGLQTEKNIAYYKEKMYYYREIAQNGLRDMIRFRLTYQSISSALFLLIATLPFVNRVSKLMGVVYLILFVRMVLRDRDFSLPNGHKWFLWSLGAVITIGFLTNSVDIIIGLKKVMYLTIFIALYYATLYFLQKGVITLKMIILSVVVSMGVYMVDGYIQFLFGYDLLFHNAISAGGVNGVSRNRNIFALAVFFFMAVLTYLMIEEKKRYSAFLLIGSTGLMLLTLCRQMWLASLLFFVIITLYRFKSLKRLSWKKLFVWGVLFSVFIWFLWSFPEVQQRLLSLESGYSSGRVELWREMLNHVSESLFFGHGFQSPLSIGGEKTIYIYAHNLTLDFLYDFGIAGILLYGLFVIYFLSMLFRCQDRQRKPYLLAMFVALLFVQQQLGGSMLIHKFIGPSILMFLAVVTYCCGSVAVVKRRENLLER